MAKVFHVLTKDENDLFVIDNQYTPLSITEDGFIHLSKADQIDEVIQKFYSNNHELILWRIAEKLILDDLVYEPPIEAPNSGINFPHLYRSLNINEVEKKFILKKDSNNKFKLPLNLLD